MCWVLLRTFPFCRSAELLGENIWGCGCNSVQGTPSALGLPERPSSLLSRSRGKALWISSCWEAVGHEAEFGDVSCINPYQVA